MNTAWRTTLFLNGSAAGSLRTMELVAGARRRVGGIVARERAHRVVGLGIKPVAVSATIGHSFHPPAALAVGRGPF